MFSPDIVCVDSPLACGLTFAASLDVKKSPQAYVFERHILKTSAPAGWYRSSCWTGSTGETGRRHCL
jgi:hypothetical protein